MRSVASIRTLPSRLNQPYTQMIGVSLLPNRAAASAAAAFGLVGLLLGGIMLLLATVGWLVSYVPRSVVPQNLHRIATRRAPGRHEGRGYGDEHEEGRCATESASTP